MAKVRSKGNRSTEAAVIALFRGASITGWRRHPKGLLGNPDFFFPGARIIVFVDGCFWHACPVCKRNSPQTRADFWQQKIDGNRRRDNRTRRKLRQQGYSVFRIWEHDLKGNPIRCIRKIAAALACRRSPAM
jgi:DNA mismatch endonuclease (patch repair protein)